MKFDLRAHKDGDSYLLIGTLPNGTKFRETASLFVTFFYRNCYNATMYRIRDGKKTTVKVWRN